MTHTIWVVEMRLPLPGIDASWTQVITWPSPEEMTEADADGVIDIYRRAMPGKEYRKIQVEVTKQVGILDREDDDIPF